MAVSILQKERVKKAAFFFAGLGHLQPMLLAATNSDYLLDRFLLEKRCSSEYVSRTITSLIFIEIVATVLMGGFGVLLGLFPDFFKSISRENEEDFRGYLTCVIQLVIFMGYFQVLRAFTSGGEEGHIQWFYFSLLFQHFFTSIIGAGIGFIDVDRALWYLMNIPVSPVIIFFYQMFIHMWARKNGLACPAYLVVKNQIWLAILNSFMATVLWTIAYFPHFLDEEPKNPGVTIELSKTKKLNNGNLHYHEDDRYATTGYKTITVTGKKDGTSPGTTQFTVRAVMDNGGKKLLLRPCMQGLFWELIAYYGTSNIREPLLIYARSDTFHYYYCKGSDNYWYRYKNGDERSKIMPEDGTATGLGKLLSVLQGPKTLTSNNFSSVTDTITDFQSDHPNYDYWKVLGNHDGGSPWNPLCWRLSGTFMPLAMHGLAVGAMGSIYPHLVPKTLVSAEHARIFNVVSMFLAAIVQILNLIFFECKSKAFANRPWEGGDKWYLTWLLYIPYFLSFLLIIFNIHYPDWSICCYVRSHTWLAFLIMLSVTFINDIFLAVGRGGIMDQRSGNRRLGGNREYLKNDHSLFNKIAPFMALSSVPFWLTTSPMIKSYAHSVGQLSDKDSWPTSCCGFWSSWGYWCKCGCHGLYTSLPKLLTFNMRTALAHKDDRLFILVTSDLPKEEWFTDW